MSALPSLSSGYSKVELARAVRLEGCDEWRRKCRELAVGVGRGCRQQQRAFCAVGVETRVGVAAGVRVKWGRVGGEVGLEAGVRVRVCWGRVCSEVWVSGGVRVVAQV